MVLVMQRMVYNDTHLYNRIISLNAYVVDFETTDGLQMLQNHCMLLLKMMFAWTLIIFASKRFHSSVSICLMKILINNNLRHLHSKYNKSDVNVTEWEIKQMTDTINHINFNKDVKFLIIRRGCDSCIYFIINWFLLNSFGKMCLVKKTYM